MANIINYENYFSKNTTAYKQNAFTLAELLVSILIISVILTLLAPVITKRAKENISINGGSSAIKLIQGFLYTINQTQIALKYQGLIIL